MPWHDSLLQLSTSITRGITHRFVVSKTARFPATPPPRVSQAGRYSWEPRVEQIPSGIASSLIGRRRSSMVLIPAVSRFMGIRYGLRDGFHSVHTMSYSVSYA